MEEAPPPPPSPLAGCYLLIVVGEPRSAEHRDAILGRVAKGFLSWDVESSHVDLEKELQALTSQAPEGEEARNGERLIQYATENLVTEVLIHPQVNTLLQCVRNLLSSFTRHRHLIHAGYTFAGTGSWVLQDGTFSLADFTDAFQETEVQRVLRAYEHSITIDVHCAPEGDWTSERMSREPFSRYCKVRINPDDRMTAGGAAIGNFINYLSAFVRAAPLESLLEPSDVVGNIRFSHPTLYVFPGGQGDAALFGINGFNMLVDGGFARKACFWDFVRHLDRLDAVLVTRLNNGNVNGMSAVLRRKQGGHVYPQIGHFFCNLQERKHATSPDGDKDRDPLLIELTVEAHEMVLNLHHLSLKPHACYSSSEPINLYHKVGHGKLDMYVLSPARDSRDLKEFLARWNATDTSKIFSSGGRKSSGSEFAFPLQNLVSICALLVWQPANPNDTITRILFPGSAPQHKIFEGIEKLRHLQFLRYPVCSAKSLSPSTSAVTISSRKQQLRSAAPAVIDKLLPGEVAKQQASPPSKPVDKAAPKSATIPVTGVEKPVQPAKTVPPSAAAPPTAAPAAAPPQVPAAKPTPPPPRAKPERLPAKTEPPKTKTEIVKTADTEKVSAKVDKSSKTEVVRTKSEHKSKTETKTSTVKSRTEIKSTRSIERKTQRTAITTSSVTEKKTDIKSSPTTPKKSVEHKVNGVAPKPEPLKHTRPSSRTRPSPTSTPAKSAKEANNRKVVESKYHVSKASKLTTSKAAKKEVQEPAAKAERKPVSRRPKAAPSSPAKIAAKSPGSPAKSSSAKSTPTPSVKSEKDAVIRRRKVDTGKITTDSSAVSTPSTAEVETIVKAKETGVVKETPLVNGHVSEIIMTKEEISKEHLDKTLEETYIEKKTDKTESETVRKSPSDDKQEVAEREDRSSVGEKEVKDITTTEEKEKQVDDETERKESEIEEKETVIEDKESEIEEKETEFEEKESEIEEKESEVEEGEDSRQLIQEKEDIEATEEEQTEEIEDDEGPVDIKESLQAELETEVRKLMREKVEGGGEDEEEGAEEEEEEQEEDQEEVEEDEEDEYLIVEKEDVESYQEQESIESHLPDDFDNKDIDVDEEDEGELQKHLLDETETEKTKKDIEKEEIDTKIHREVVSRKEKEVDGTLESKAEKEITETEKTKDEQVEEIKRQERDYVTEQTAKPLKEEITKDHIEEKVEEIISSAKEIVIKGKLEDERKPGVSQESDKDIQKEELSESKKEPETSEDLKEISSISPEEKIDISSEKVRETTDTDHKLDDGGHEMKEIPSKEIPEQKFIAEESQPDEKASTTIESAATTAPTLPEDERIPLDEIKEIVEEKYVKEETKEKEKPVAEVVTRLEQPTTLPQVVMPIFETHIAHGIIHQRDIVKTPDEVADLPVHEEVDPGMYDADDFVRDFHKAKYEVQLSKKQDTQDIKDHITEMGAKEERLKIDTGKADTLKESLKQFEDEKEVEEVKIEPEERFIDETEDMKHVKSEVPDVAKPSEPAAKEDMVKPTDESKPVTMISEEKLVEATFQTYADLKATKEKVDELKEKFSEEAKKAIDKEVDYTTTSATDIAPQKITSQEMREEKETEEREKIGAEDITHEKKSEGQLETTTDELKQKETQKVISEEISTLRQTYTKEVFEEREKDEEKSLPKDVAQQKITGEKQKAITEDVIKEIEKQEGDKVVPETKIEKEVKEDEKITLKEMVEGKTQEIVTEDIAERVKMLEDKQKLTEQEVVEKQTKDVEEEVEMVERLEEDVKKIAITEDITKKPTKLEEAEIFLQKEISEKEPKTEDVETSDQTVKEIKKEETEKFVAEDIKEEIKKVEDQEKPVPKEVSREEIIKDVKILADELVKEKEIAEKEKLIAEDDSEGIKKLEKPEIVEKEIVEETIKEKKEVPKEVAEGQMKEERVVKEDIIEEIKDLEGKDKPTPKEVSEKEMKEEDKTISKDMTEAEKKEEKVVTEDITTEIPKLEEKDRDVSKKVDEKEEPTQKEVAKEETKEEDRTDLKEVVEEVTKETKTVTEDIITGITKLEDKQKVAPEEIDEGKTKDKKKEDKEKVVTGEVREETVSLEEKEKLLSKDAGKEKPKEKLEEEVDKTLKELEHTQKLSPSEVEEIQISKEKIPEKKEEEVVTEYSTEETEILKEKEKIYPKEIVDDKAKTSEETDSKEIVDEKKKDEKEAVTEEIGDKKEKQGEREKPSSKAVEEELSVSKDATEKEETVKDDATIEIKKPQEMEKTLPKELVEDEEKEDEEKKKSVTRDMSEEILKPEEKEKPAPKEMAEKKIKEDETLVSKEAVEEHKGEEKETDVTEDITEEIKQLEEKEKPSPTKISELEKKEDEPIVLKEKIGEKMGDDKVITEDTVKEATQSEEGVKIKAKEEDEKVIEEEKDKAVPSDILVKVKELEVKDEVAPKGTVEKKVKEEEDIISQKMAEEKVEEKEKVVPEEVTEEIKKLDTVEKLVAKEISEEKPKEEERTSSKGTEQKKVTEGKEEEKDTCSSKEEVEEKIQEEWEIVSKEMVEEEQKEDTSKVVTEESVAKIKKPDEKEISIPKETDKEKKKEPEETVSKDAVVKTEEEKDIVDDVTEEVKKRKEQEIIAPHEIVEEKAKEPEKTVSEDTKVKKEEEKIPAEDIIQELKKSEEKEKIVPHDIVEEKAKESEKTVAKDTIETKEEEKIPTEDITQELKKTEEKEKMVAHEVAEEKTKEPEKTVAKDAIEKKEEEEITAEDITEEVKKTEEQKKIVAHEAAEEKTKEPEKTISKDTVMKKEEDKITAEDITEEVIKTEEKEKKVAHEIAEEKAKEPQKIVAKDTIEKKEEEKITTEDITKGVKKPEEKEKIVPLGIAEEKAKEPEKTAAKDTSEEKEEVKITAEDITEEVKKPEEKEKTLLQEIAEEKAKEPEKTVSKDTVMKTKEDITEEVKKSEDKEKIVPQEIAEEKAKEPEITVLKEISEKMKEDTVVTDAAIGEPKKPEEIKKDTEKEIIKEEIKEVEKIIAKDSVEKKKEDKILTDDVTEEVKKLEAKEKVVPKEISDEVPKEQQETVSIGLIEGIGKGVKEDVVKDSTEFGQKEEKIEKIISKDLVEGKKTEVPEEVTEEKKTQITDKMEPRDKDREIFTELVHDEKTEQKEIVSMDLDEKKMKDDASEDVTEEITKLRIEKDETVPTADRTEVQKEEVKQKPVTVGDEADDREKIFTTELIEHKHVTKDVVDKDKKEEKGEGILKDQVDKKDEDEKDKEIVTVDVMTEKKKEKETDKPSVPEKPTEDTDKPISKEASEEMEKELQEISKDKSIEEKKETEAKQEITSKDLVTGKKYEDYFASVVTEKVSVEEIKKPEEKQEIISKVLVEDEKERKEKSILETLVEGKRKEEEEKIIPEERKKDSISKEVAEEREKDGFVARDVFEETEQKARTVPTGLIDKKEEKFESKDLLDQKKDSIIEIKEVVAVDKTEEKKEDKDQEKITALSITEERQKDDGKEKTVPSKPIEDQRKVTSDESDKKVKDMEKEKQPIISTEMADEESKSHVKERSPSKIFEEEKKKGEKDTLPDMMEEKKDVLLSEKMDLKERSILEDLLDGKKKDEEKEKVVPKDLTKEEGKVGTVLTDDTEKKEDDKEKKITEKVIEEKTKESDRTGAEDTTSIREEETEKDKIASKELLAEKKKEEEKETATKDVIKDQQETEKIVSEQISEEVGREETTAKVVPKDVVEEKTEDFEKRKTVSVQEKISDKIETTDSRSDISDIKTDLPLQDTEGLTDTIVGKVTEKEVKPAEIIKTEEKLEKSVEEMAQVKKHEETVVKGEPESKADQKVELGSETIKAPSALSATYLEIIDKLQKEEPSKIDEKEDQKSLKKEELKFTEAEKSPLKEESRTTEKSKEISVTATPMSETSVETGIQKEKEERKEYTTETEKLLVENEKITEKTPTDTTIDKQILSKERRDDAVKETRPVDTKESDRKEEEKLSEEKPFLQAQKPITEKDKPLPGAEKEDKKLKVEADSEETEKPSTTVEWLTCVVKDTKPPLAEEHEEIFKKVVVKEKTVSETVDQIAPDDEKKVKEIKEEIEKADKLIEKTVMDTKFTSVISEISKEVSTVMDQKKQPVEEREIFEESVDIVKSQPKYETDRPTDTLTETHLKDKKDEFTKPVSSVKEKQLTDEEEKKLKTETLFPVTESTVISKDIAETISTSVMKEYILKTTHITSDSVISDAPVPGKMPLPSSVEPEIMPSPERVQIKETGLAPKVDDTDRSTAEAPKEEPGKEKRELHEHIALSSTVIEKTVSKEKTPPSEEIDKDETVKATSHMFQEPPQTEREPQISQDTTVSKVKEVSKEVKGDAITSKSAISPAGHRSDDEDGEPPPSPGEEYIDSGMEEEPVYTKLDAPELPEYVTVTPDSTPASPKALPFRLQDDSAKTQLPGSDEKERKEILKSEHTDTDKKEPAKVTTAAVPHEKEMKYRMYVDEVDDKAGKPEVHTDKDGQTVITKEKTEYTTVVTREDQPNEKGTSIPTAGSARPVTSSEITTYTTVVQDDKLSDEEHLEEIDDDSKESISEETFTDEDGRTVTRKIVRRYKTVVTSRTESTDEKGVTKDVQASFLSESGPKTLPLSSKTTTTKVIEGHEYPLDSDDQDEKAGVSEETFTDKDGKIVTRRIVRHYKTYVTHSTGGIEPTHIKTDDGTPLEVTEDIVTRKIHPTVSTEGGTTEETKEFDDDDEKESVTEETFTDEDGRTVTRKVIRRYKTVITKESEVVDEKPTVKFVTTETKKTETKDGDDVDDGVEMEECTELGDQDDKESVSEETFVDENGKTVTRKIVRRYKTIVTRESESVGTKDSTQSAPKEGESIVEEIEEEAGPDDQSEKESVTEETFTDESGRTVTRKIVRRYKTIVTKESSSVGAEDSIHRRSDITTSELPSTVLTQKTYTTVIKSDDDKDDGVETDKLDEFDDQDEKESVSEETFTDENGRTVRRRIVRHYKTIITQEGESTDEKDSTHMKIEKISAPELTSTATTSKSYTTVLKEGEDEDDGIEISDQDGKESVSEETFTDENGRTVTRKIVRRYKTVVVKESGSSEVEKTDVRDLEQSSTATTKEMHTTVLDDVERDEHTDFDDQDEKESVSEETFTDENGKTVTRKIVRRYKTVVTKESKLPDEKDSQLRKEVISGSELPTTTILRKIYTTVTKDGESTKDGLETEQLEDLDDQDGKESITEETFTDENGRTVTRRIVRKYKTVVTTEGEDISGDISDDGRKDTDDDDSKDSVLEETFTDEEGRTVRKIVKHYKTTVLKADDVTDKVLSTKEIEFDPDIQEGKSIAFSSFITTAEGKSDIPLDITEGSDGKDSVIEETFTGEDGSVVTRKITRQYKTVLTKDTGSDDHHFTTKISTGSVDSSLPLTTTTMTKTYTTVTKQGDDYSDDFLEDLGKAHEPSGATSKTTTTVTTITKRISSKDGEEEITEATTEEVTSEDGKEQSTVTVTTKRDEHGDMVVHTSITPRDKKSDGYTITGPASFIGSDKKGEHSSHSTVTTTVTTSKTTTEPWKTGRKHDPQLCDSDEEDDPTSPLSITSQIAHSPPSHFGFETASSPTAATELYSPKGTSSQKVTTTQMTSSFYGSLPSGEEQLTSADEELDFQRALHEHRETRGEDLPSAFHSLPLHKTVTVGYKEGLAHGEQLLSAINGQKHEDIDSKGATAKTIPSSSGVTAPSQKIPPVVTSSHLPAEHDQSTRKDMSGDKQKDPIGSWGKPLGLPAPAPPPANTITTNGEVNAATKPGTPKKEKKAMQMKKNLVMNENNKAANAQSTKESKSRRSESPVKQKNVSNKDVGKNTKVPGGHIYIDLTYVPHHGNSYYTNVEFFKKVRARYYVFSGTEPSRDVYNALLEAKQTWEDKDLEVTIIPTYDTDTLGYWVAENEDLLTKYKIDLSPSASRCTINLQDHETSCSAYRLEF